MSNEFRFLIRLIIAGCRGEKITKPEFAVDWKKIEQLANEQMAAALVGYALKLSGNIGCPDEIYKRFVLTMRRAAISNFTRKTEIIRLLGRMNGQGIHAVLLKGYEAATNYKAPECRSSADTDVLVDPKDEEKACAFLEKEGFKVEKRWEHGHHAVAKHPVYGIVELHVLLYDEIIEKMWFDMHDGINYVCEPHRAVQTEDGTYFALGETDHLIFLALHMIKHFIQSGLSLRMMMDTALWIASRKNRIDMNRFWRVMDELKYRTLMNAILQSLIHYGTFEKDDFPGIMETDTEKMDLILSDLEAGGWMGMKDKSEREYGWYEYNRQKIISVMKPWQYRLYMLKWQADALKVRVFLGQKELARQYPIAMKSKLLVPFLSVYRLLDRGLKVLRKGALTKRIVADDGQLSEEGQNRVTMFRQLDML